MSSTPWAGDLDGDGKPWLAVGGPRLQVRDLEGRMRAGWPRRGGRPFASSPAVADLDGDGRPEIVCGCDDGRVYAWRADGTPLPGWPVATGRDVYSSPCLVDLDGDGRPEVVVGSDDGLVHALRADGTPLPGWPVPTGGFVAASPAVADLDGDGRPELVATSWDGRVHAWRSDGSPQPGWPLPLGHLAWASPTVARLDGELRVLVASDTLSCLDAATGRPIWSAPLGCLAVARPLVARHGGRDVVVQAADQVYAFDGTGRPWPGFPVDLGTYAWGTPATVQPPGGAALQLLVPGWDGQVHSVGLDGTSGAMAATDGPLFASPTVVPVASRRVLLQPSWDGQLHAWTLQTAAQELALASRAAAAPARRPGSATPRLVGDRPPGPIHVEVGPARHRKPTWVRVVAQQADADLRRYLFLYQVRGEGTDHPVPLFRHAGAWLTLVQPLGLGHRIDWSLRAPSGGAVAHGAFTVGGRAAAAARLVHPLWSMTFRPRHLPIGGG